MIALLTANIGDFDEVVPVPKQSVHYDYFLYTENNIPFPLSVFQNRQKYTYLKLQSHRFLDYDYFVWIDGRVEVIHEDFLKEITEQTKEISILKHPIRKIVYDEYEFIFDCFKGGGKAKEYLSSRYDLDALKKERLKIKADLPLFACGVFCWKVSDKMKRFMNQWYRRTIEYSGFDQCWVSQIAHDCGITITPFGHEKIKIGKHK